MALSGALLSSGNGGLAVAANPHLVEIFFSITASGSYTTGGDTLNLTAITGAPGLSIPPNTSELPLQIVITGVKGYVYEYSKGSDLTDGVVLVRQSASSGSPLAEISAGSYPSGVTGDTILARATFLRG